MANEDLAAKFHEVALRVYEDGKRATGYRGTRYLQKVRRDTGLRAAKSWLKQRGHSDAPTGGFLKLVECGRLDVSLEAQVVKEPWSSLFSQEELAVASNRLARYGYFDSQESVTHGDKMLPEEVDSQGVYIEGARMSVTINAFERNRQARDACVAHYGAKCYVCGMTFQGVYGSAADGIIHVHHLCSLCAVVGEYRIDPIADLRPVCPNCHAVLHLRKPPFTVDEVRKMIAAARV